LGYVGYPRQAVGNTKTFIHFGSAFAVNRGSWSGVLKFSHENFTKKLVSKLEIAGWCFWKILRTFQQVGFVWDNSKSNKWKQFSIFFEKQKYT
jgi:hypothetical protein